MIWELKEHRDHRQQNRFGLTMQASFSWSSVNGEPQYGDGVTRDVGAHSVYIYARHMPIVGAAVAVNLSFPALDRDGTAPMLSGRGTVVRLDPAGSAASGFAVVVRFAVSQCERPSSSQRASLDQSP